MNESIAQYRKTFTTIAVSAVAFFINYLITMFLTPVITDSVGTEAYGFVSLAKNIAQYATYITAALNSFAVRFISVEYHSGKMERANTYFSSVFYGDVVLATVIFALAMVAVVFLEHLFQIPANIVPDVKFLFIFIFFKFWLGTVCSAYESGGMIKNKLTLTSLFKILSYIAEIIVLVGLFSILKPHVAYVGIGILAASAVETLSHVFITKKYTPELKTERKLFNWGAVKNLVGNGIWSSITSLGAFLNNGLDMMICNLLIGALAMGQLAIAETVILIFSSILSLITHPFVPMYLKSYAAGNKEKLLGQFKNAMRLSSMTSGIIIAGFITLGRVYYKLWIPNENTELIYGLSVVASIPVITSGIVAPVVYAYTLTLKKKWPCVATICSGLLNVSSMYVTIKFMHLGIYAVVGTTAVITTTLYLAFHAPYAAKVLKCKWYYFYPTIFRSMLSFAAILCVFKGLSRLYMPGSWITLILTAGVYAMIGAVIHVLIVLDYGKIVKIIAVVVEEIKNIIRKRS